MWLRKPVGRLVDIARAAFPAYAGRQFRIKAAEALDVRSYWSGGSRSYYVFVRVADLQTLTMPPQSLFDRPVPGADRAPVPPGFVCVEHQIFCGKDLGLTFHVHPADLPPLLPLRVTLPWAQQVVLYATSTLKSSYHGDSQVRLHEAARAVGITQKEWDEAKADCVRAGYLNARGALTVEGRNVVGDCWPADGARK